MKNLEEAFDTVKELLSFLSEPLFTVGDHSFTISNMLIVIAGISFVVILSGWVKSLLIKKILKNRVPDSGLRNTIGIMVRWIILLLGLFVILDSVGIKLGTLGVLFGALGVGIGFGLQNITDNFISGIIILLERPIKIGDRVEVDDMKGDVINISARATTIVTNDNITLIIPNSQFISKTVINWSHNDSMVRFRFPVGVSYKEDPEKVRKVMMDVIKNNEGVLKEPEPDVIFEGFGDSSLDFELFVWTSKYTQRPSRLKSQLYYEIFKKFKEHDIEIPFPQRDVHIKTETEKSIVLNKN
ncbi:MAG: mechanosensitive ion channel domain-containing protein [Chitinophagales bacterium]